MRNCCSMGELRFALLIDCHYTIKIMNEYILFSNILGYRLFTQHVKGRGSHRLPL